MSRSRIARPSLALLPLALAAPALAQSAGPIYTWDGPPSVESWVKNFGANTVTLNNATPGVLTIIETADTDVAISDGANRVRESAPNASGGTDLTGLSALEFVLGHNGAAPIPVQFFVQAGTGFNYVALAPDILVQPGINTYQLPLSSLTPAQQVYIRTIGFFARSHAAAGPVTWSLEEVRSVGPELTQRDLITHDAGTPEGGLQGAIANFDVTAIAGNNGGQNQTGLSHNPAGSGSLQWTDLGGSQGAAVSWGNGTAWNGNTFNNRTTDLSNYQFVTFRVSATDPAGATGNTLGMSAFFQTNNFQFNPAEGGAGQSIPIDGQFHDVTFSLAGLNHMNAVDLTGLNIFSHPQDLIINVDLVRFTVPEPTSLLTTAALTLPTLLTRRRRPNSPR